MIYTWFKQCCQNCDCIICGHETVNTKDNKHTIIYCGKYPFCNDFCADEESKRILRPIAYLQELLIEKILPPRANNP